MLTVTFHRYVQIWMVHVSICWRETLCDLIILSFNGGLFKGWLNMYYCRRGRGCWWYVEPRGILVIGGNEEHLHESFKRMQLIGYFCTSFIVRQSSAIDYFVTCYIHLKWVWDIWVGHPLYHRFSDTCVCYPLIIRKASNFWHITWYCLIGWHLLGY